VTPENFSPVSLLLQLQIRQKMPKKKKSVNMNYRFTEDLEPSDEQLNVIMQKVGENIRRESKKISILLRKKIEKEFQKKKNLYAKS